MILPQPRSDSRVMGLMLIESVMPMLRGTATTAPDEVETICAINVMRLLERYRHDVMRTTPEISQEPMDWIAVREDTLEGLERCLIAAHNAVFGASQGRIEVVTILRRVLRRRVTGRQNDPAEVTCAREFFECALREIEAVLEGSTPGKPVAA